MLATHNWQSRIDEFSEAIRQVENMLCNGEFMNAADSGTRTAQSMVRFAAQLPKDLQHRMKLHAVRLLYRVGNYRSGIDILSRCYGDDEVIRLMQVGEVNSKNRMNAYDFASKLLDSKKWSACLEYLAQRDIDINWRHVCRLRAECCRQLGGNLGKFADEFDKEAIKFDPPPRDYSDEYEPNYSEPQDNL